MLVDNHDRKIDYLRLAVTDRCNLRCNYCMPAEGINFAKNDKLFTIDELARLSEILVSQGIDKIRITGGEPFVRKDLMVLLRRLSKLEGLNDISITTNATTIGKYIDELKALGIVNVNVSMDAINRETFEKITRRNHYDIVHNNIIRLITEGFNVRINFIALEGQNTEDILPMLELTKHYDVSVRFLEEMPFNGGSKNFEHIAWDYKRILEYIKEAHPEYYKLESPKTSTSINYKIPDFKGSFGVIPSFSRTFLRYLQPFAYFCGRRCDYLFVRQTEYEYSGYLTERKFGGQGKGADFKGHRWPRQNGSRGAEKARGNF